MDNQENKLYKVYDGVLESIIYMLNDRARKHNSLILGNFSLNNRADKTIIRAAVMVSCITGQPIYIEKEGFNLSKIKREYKKFGVVFKKNKINKLNKKENYIDVEECVESYNESLQKTLEQNGIENFDDYTLDDIYYDYYESKGVNYGSNSSSSI